MRKEGDLEQATGHYEEESKGIELPSWLFDVDEDDEDLTKTNATLLQELEIDLEHIYKNVVWMLVGPFVRFTGRGYKRHPLYVSSSNAHRQSIDFWGPCSVISLYSLILWLGDVHEIVWIFVIWSCAACLNHLLSRVFYPSSLLIHVALLGYALTPMLPLALLILLVRPPVWLCGLLQMVGVAWASASAILSYATIVTVSAEQRGRLRLLFPTVVLMTLYITSLMPLQR